MAILDLYIYIGDEQVAGGAESTRPGLAWPSSLGGRSAGFASMMNEAVKVVPSGVDGVTGGTYDPYWDGTEFSLASTASSTTTVVSAAGSNFSVGELNGREIEFTGGALTGTKRRIVSNTQTTITVSPALPSTPAEFDAFVVRGGFVKFFHAPTSSLSGLSAPYIADQRNARGDCWFSASSALTPTATWMSRLEQLYRGNANGFRYLKLSYPGVTNEWLRTGSAGSQLAANLTRAIEYESAQGNTLRVRAICLDSCTRDAFGVNLLYPSDLQRTIDSLRAMVDDLQLTTDADKFTATSSTASSLTVASANWPADNWKGRTVRIDNGTQAGQLRLVAGNTANTITFYSNLLSSPGQNYGPLPASPGNAEFSILQPSLVVVGAPKNGLASSLSTAISPTVRLAIRNAVARNQAVRTFDWEIGDFGINAELTGAAGDRYYDTPSYLLAGFGWFNAVQAFYTQQPTLPPGSPIPAVFMIGNSQLVTSSVQGALLPFLLSQSLSGATSWITPGIWIWDDLQERVVPYDPMTNASTMGTVGPFFGPELTFGRDLVRDQYPNGVVLFKVAKSGASMTVESQLSGGTHDPTQPEWQAIAEKVNKFRQACIRDINRQADFVAGWIDHGENDIGSPQLLDIWQSKLPEFAQSVRDLVRTRVSGPEMPILWMQGPPPATEVQGGSVYQPTEMRQAYRNAIAELPGRVPRLTYISNSGPREYGLQRLDNTHYDVEATLAIGRKACAVLIPMLSDEGGEPVEPDPETAAFVVEDGRGLPSANALVSVELVDAYAVSEFGQAAPWLTRTTEQKQDRIRKSSRWITYGHRFEGSKRNRDQSMAFPRVGLCDEDGWVVDSDSVPDRVKEATAIAAILIDGGFQPFPAPEVTPSNDGIAASTLTIGPITISETFRDGGSPARTPTVAKIPLVQRLLSPFLEASSGRRLARG